MPVGAGVAVGRRASRLRQPVFDEPARHAGTVRPVQASVEADAPTGPSRVHGPQIAFKRDFEPCQHRARRVVPLPIPHGARRHAEHLGGAALADEVAAAQLHEGG